METKQKHHPVEWMLVAIVALLSTAAVAVVVTALVELVLHPVPTP